MQELESDRLVTLLRGKIGIAVGDFPAKENFDLVTSTKPLGHSAFSEEKLLDRVASLDFILLDAECAFLSELPYILENLTKKLTPHGLILLFDRGALHEASIRRSLWHRILASGEVEFLSEEASPQGTLYLFQWIKPRAAVAALPKPLRYRIADRLNELLSRIPGVKPMLKNLVRGFRNPLGAGAHA